MLHGEPYADAAMRIPCFAGIEEGTWITEGVVSTAAAALKWLRNTLFPGAAYNELTGLAARRSQNSPFFYPHLAGASSPQWYGQASGSFFGITLDTEPADIVYSVLEGVAFQVRANLDAMDPGGITKVIRAFGGGAKSPYWCQCISDATGLPVEVPPSVEAACRGAAMMAGLGAGLFTGFDELRGLSGTCTAYQPDSMNSERMNGRYAQYCEIEKKLYASL